MSSTQIYSTEPGRSYTLTTVVTLVAIAIVVALFYYYTS